MNILLRPFAHLSKQEKTQIIEYKQEVEFITAYRNIEHEELPELCAHIDNLYQGKLLFYSFSCSLLGYQSEIIAIPTKEYALDIIINPNKRWTTEKEREQAIELIKNLTAEDYKQLCKQRKLGRGAMEVYSLLDNIKREVERWIRANYRMLLDRINTPENIEACLVNIGAEYAFLRTGRQALALEKIDNCFELLDIACPDNDKEEQDY